MTYSGLHIAQRSVTMLMIPQSLHAIRIKQLDEDSSVIVKRLSDNFLKLHDDKCHLEIFGDKSTEATVSIGNSRINESDYEKLLGVTFDRKLSFKKHVEDLHRGISLNIRSYYLVFLDIVIFNIFIISRYCCLSCF